MSTWVIKLIAASLTLTVCSFILPTGNIKKTAVMLFGFLFVSVLVAPVSLIAEKDLINEARLLFVSEYNKEINIEGQGGSAVVKEYTATIANVIKNYINDNSNYYCDSCRVYVNDDIESPDFGKITTVYCYISEEKKDNSIIQSNKNQIHQIVIDINGIHTEKDNKPSDDSYKDKARKLVAEYLKIDINKIHILDIKEQ